MKNERLLWFMELSRIKINYLHNTVREILERFFVR